MTIFTKTIGEGKDVVLLHGWTHDHHSMEPIAELLKSNYRVTLVDLPGAGKSDWSDNIKDANDAADLLLPHLPEKAIYIGWSWGGFPSISIAARFPNRVERFIGIGTGPRLIEDTDWPGVPKPGFSAFFTATTDDELREVIHGFYENEFSNIPHGEKARKRLLDIIQENGLPMAIDAWQKGVEISDITDLREEYKTITCPLDFIVGTLDEAILLDWEKVKALNSRTDVHFIEDAHHMPMWTHPDEFAKVLKNILDN